MVARLVMARREVARLLDGGGRPVACSTRNRRRRGRMEAITFPVIVWGSMIATFAVVGDRVFKLKSPITIREC